MISTYLHSLRENNYREQFENAVPKSSRKSVPTREEYICELTPELVEVLEKRKIKTLKDLAKFTTALGLVPKVTFD